MRLRHQLVSGAFSVCALATLTAQKSSPDPLPRDPRQLLRDVVRMSDEEWAAIDRGEAVANVLDANGREIAVAGAVRIAASSERLAARVRDIEALERSAIVLQAGRFGRVPLAADLVPLRFEERSLDLRDCQPQDCRVRLSAADITRFHREVDWRRKDWRDRSASIWRDVLAGYASAYASGGRRALPLYANKRETLSVGSELSLLVEKFGFVAAYSPEFLAYLREFGPERPSGTENVLYWTKEDFGLRPVVRISHQTIYRTSNERSTVLIATNQVYADHYLDAALTLTLAIDASDAGRGQGIYMIAVSHARTRSLSGLFRGFVRSMGAFPICTD